MPSADANKMHAHRILERSKEHRDRQGEEGEDEKEGKQLAREEERKVSDLVPTIVPRTQSKRKTIESPSVVF